MPFPAGNVIRFHVTMPVSCQAKNAIITMLHVFSSSIVIYLYSTTITFFVMLLFYTLFKFD